MTVQHYSFSDVPQFSHRDTAYTTGAAALRPFYQHEVTIEAFADVLTAKRKQSIDRTALVGSINAQYATFDKNPSTQSQIDCLLDENTFTVITAHQPSLFTGPLYFIYKIFSAIKLAEQLNAEYTDVHIVPIFVLGGEDHDFEEINHLHLFGKTIEWQNEEQGAVGMMKTDSLAPVLEELKEILGTSENAQHIFGVIERCFTGQAIYGRAMQAFVHELFQSYGLLVLSMNDPSLKQHFIPQIKTEIFDQPSEKLIQATQGELATAGFGAQAMPRAINFFYLRDQVRARLVEEDGVFSVLDTDYRFTKAELEAEIEAHPERFSPNVVMRPVYQEAVLPNLAYIGGGGELAYWQERLSQFAHFEIPFPMLVRRDSVLWLDKGSQKRLQKLNLSLDEFFQGTEHLIKSYVKEHTQKELSLAEEKTAITAIFEQILEKAIAIDSTLKKSVMGEQTKQLNALKGLEAKLLRAEKNQHDVALNQIRSLKDKFFPNNGLQERYDNFLPFYLKHGNAFFDTLYTELDPLRKQLTVILE